MKRRAVDKYQRLYSYAELNRAKIIACEELKKSNELKECSFEPNIENKRQLSK